MIVWVFLVSLLFDDPTTNWTAIGGAATSIAALASGASAAGAFFAAHVALTSRKQEEAARKASEALKARMVAIGLIPIIKQMRTDLEALGGELPRARKKLTTHEKFNHDHIYERHLRTLLSALTDKITIEDVTLLAPNAPAAADCLAEARSLIRILDQEIVQRGLDWTEMRQLQNERFEPDQEEWCGLANAADSLLKTAGEHCTELLAGRESKRG